MNQRDYDLIMQNRLFGGVDFAAVEYMLERCSIKDLDGGEKLLQPDVDNAHLYLILEGELAVHLVAQENIKYATLQAGECVGEISLVDGNPPSAMVDALRPTRVLAVPEDTVWSLVDSSHAISRNLLGIVAGRMRHGSRALICSQNERTQYQQQAYVDALTGIHNRHWMNDAFPRALQRCVLNSSPATFMVADLDHFKRVNDTYGHLAGDVTLKVVAGCMARQLRLHDLLVRYGGEEFVMLLPDTGTEEAQQIAERLCASVAEHEIPNGAHPFQVTLSIGIATTHVETAVDILIGNADRALYRAKNLGRNCVEIFD